MCIRDRSGGVGCGNYGNGCGICSQSTANSLYPGNANGCSPGGLSSQYASSSFVTTQLFTDMFYNTYSPGSSNSFVTFANGILYIYTLYCAEWFIVGISRGNAVFASYYNGNVCGFNNVNANPIYLQLYLPTQTAPYIGVQIELTT